MAIIASTNRTDKSVEKEIEKFAKNYANQKKYSNEVKEIKVEVRPIFSRHIL